MKSRVRIGYQAEFPPFMQDRGGPQGLVIDALASAVAAIRGRGVEVDWVPLALAAQERALIEGEVDLLAGLGITAERAERLVFGNPLVRTGGALFRVRDTHGLERIVTPTSGPLHAPAREAFPDCQVLDAVDYPTALAGVLAGQADAAALNLHVGAVLAERDHPGRFEVPDELFVVVELAPAYPPDHDPELKRLVDRHSDN